MACHSMGLAATQHAITPVTCDTFKLLHSLLYSQKQIRCQTLQVMAKFVPTASRLVCMAVRSNIFSG
jgi:hypothetical protein